jgi:hypothetical protein
VDLTASFRNPRRLFSGFSNLEIRGGYRDLNEFFRSLLKRLYRL